MDLTKFLSLLLFSFLVVSCAHVRSGQYVQVHKKAGLEEIAKRYHVSVSDLKEANSGKAFVEGEWIFVPTEFGVASYFRKPAQDNSSESLAPQASDDEEESDRSHLGLSVDPQSTGFLWPVPASRRLSSSYGERWGRQHEGIDIAAPIGSHILAVDDGVVIYSGQEIGGYGNLTILAHRKGYFSIYAHAMKNYSTKGQRVHKGQVIALVGMTGRSTGPHLHFEVRRNSQAQNPEEFVSAKKP